MIVGLFGIVIVVLVVALWLAVLDKQYLTSKNKELESKKRSLETTYGYAVENLTPFIAEMRDRDPKLFRQLGQPIDYIYWGEDEITFIEVKSGNARLNEKQRKIKKLIEDKKVVFEEVRIKR